MNDECGNEIISKKKTLIYWPGLPSCILCDVLCTVYVLLIPLTRCSYSLMYFVVCVFDIDILSFSFSLVYFSFPSLPPLLTPVFFLPSSYLCPFLPILTHMSFSILLLFVLLPFFLLIYSSVFFSLFFFPSPYSFILLYSFICPFFLYLPLPIHFEAYEKCIYKLEAR